MVGRVGILAYGSVITDPGEEIQRAIVETRKGILTPFNIEFARKSQKRAGAPTLVPVPSGGNPVRATLIVLNVTEQEAANYLYRRELNQVSQADVVYTPKRKPTVNTVIIDRWENFEGVPVVLSVRLGANIEPLAAAELAALAIASARSPLNNGRDGISYLINAKKEGIQTPLSPAYEEEIKRQTRTGSLEDALAKTQAEVRRSLGHVISVLASFIWDIHLKRALHAADGQPRLNFWRVIYGNLMDMAAIEWCKLFGSDHEQHQPAHWKNVIPEGDHDAFRKRLLAALKISPDDWLAYRDKIKDYRDNQAAHFRAAWLESPNGQQYPELEIGLKAVYFYYGEIVARLNANGVTNHYPDDIEDYCRRFLAQATDAADKAIAATADMVEKVR